MVGADEGSFDGYSDDAVRPYSGGDGDPVVRRSTGTFRACEKPARPCFEPRRRESGPPSRLGSRYLLTLAITPRTFTPRILKVFASQVAWVSASAEVCDVYDLASIRSYTRDPYVYWDPRAMCDCVTCVPINMGVVKDWMTQRSNTPVSPNPSGGGLLAVYRSHGHTHPCIPMITGILLYDLPYTRSYTGAD